jgi:hypothetical protein
MIEEDPFWNPAGPGISLSNALAHDSFGTPL